MGETAIFIIKMVMPVRPIEPGANINVILINAVIPVGGPIFVKSGFFMLREFLNVTKGNATSGPWRQLKSAPFKRWEFRHDFRLKGKLGVSMERALSAV